MTQLNYDDLFNLIEHLVLCHSPSGFETEIDRFLLAAFAALKREVWQDPAGNIIVKIPGQTEASALAITAHKDEIGMMVRALQGNGRIALQPLGGAYPWVYGEGVVDLLGDEEIISGVLSFGSRHVSHLSRQSRLQDQAPVRWEDAWVETKRSAAALEAAGIRPGTPVVVGKHRKRSFRMGDYISSYTLDNKASLAILLELAKTLTQPQPTVYLVASAKEEVGAVGAMYFTQRLEIDRLIALEICPLSSEYPLQAGSEPVLLTRDAYGLYDDRLTQDLRTAAIEAGVPVQLTTLERFGSDASIAMKFGHIAQGACLSFPTHNTHGYEITHLGAIVGCIEILQAYCNAPAAA
ncbi:MAG: M42 family metallopeptidase [Prochlorotrichaceae cyanobacterium]